MEFPALSFKPEGRGQSFIGTAPPLFARFWPETAAPLTGWRLCVVRADDRKEILDIFFSVC